jgi:hypothetical protein
MLKKKIWANFQRISQKIVTKLSKISVWGQGFGSPGSQDLWFLYGILKLLYGFRRRIRPPHEFLHTAWTQLSQIPLADHFLDRWRWVAKLV